MTCAFYLLKSTHQKGDSFDAVSIFLNSSSEVLLELCYILSRRATASEIVVFEFFFGILGIRHLERGDASTNWNLATDDDVLLEAVHVVDTTIDGGIDEDASRILEGCSREE